MIYLYYYSEKANQKCGHNFIEHKGRKYKYTGMFQKGTEEFYGWDDKILVLEAEKEECEIIEHNGKKDVTNFSFQKTILGG